MVLSGVRLIEKPKKVVEDTHWVNYNEFYHIWVGDANESGSTGIL